MQLLAEAGTRRKEDRERAWLDFRGWWATDDTVLLQLANITMAPTARWTSDRSIASRHTAVPRVWRSPHGDGRRTSR